MVDAIIKNDNVSAEKAFNDSVSHKVGDALEIKRRNISKTFVGSGFSAGAIPTNVESEED